MQLCDLGEGFGLVALRESRGLHPNHPRAPERVHSARQYARALTENGCFMNGRIIANFDPMAYQLTRILRDVLAQEYNAR